MISREVFVDGGARDLRPCAVDPAEGDGALLRRV
jgi:hypothetical protein